MRPPDIGGEAGRGWDLTPADHATCVSYWLLHVPGAHPFWGWYTVTGVHLRGLMDGEPAKLQFEGATHEIMIWAVDPEPGDPPLDPEKIRRLTPVNLVQQFTLPDDATMVKLVGIAAEAFVRGLESPDTDYRSRTESALAVTAEHLALGCHCHDTDTPH